MSSFRRILRDALETGSILSAGLGCLFLFRREIYPHIFGPIAYGLFTAGAVRFVSFLIDLQSNDDFDDTSNRELLRSFEDHQTVLQENKSVLDELEESYTAIRDILESWQRDPPLLADRQVILDRILQIQDAETSGFRFKGNTLETLSDVRQSISRFSVPVRGIAHEIEANRETATFGLNQTVNEPAKLKVQVLNKLQPIVLKTLTLPKAAGVQDETLEKEDGELAAKLKMMVLEDFKKRFLKEEEGEKSSEETPENFQELINRMQSEISVSESAEQYDSIKLAFDVIQDAAVETLKGIFEKDKEEEFAKFFEKGLEGTSRKMLIDEYQMKQEHEVAEEQKDVKLTKSLQEEPEEVKSEKTSDDGFQVKQEDVEISEHLKEDEDKLNKSRQEDTLEKASTEGYEVEQKDEVSEKLKEDKSIKSLKQELEEAKSIEGFQLEEGDI